MKLLFESWSKFLTEEASDSVDAFKKIVKTHKDKIVDLMNNVDFVIALLNQSEDLVNNCPPLKTDKINNILGIGTQGIVFSLESGRALKLFAKGYIGGSGSEELAFYKSSEGSLFGGEGTRETLPVFDSGSFKIELQNPKDPNTPTKDLTIHYAVMSRLITLKNYFEKKDTYRMVSGRITNDEVFNVLDMIKELVMTDISEEEMESQIGYFAMDTRFAYGRNPTRKEIAEFIVDFQKKLNDKRRHVISLLKRASQSLGIQPYEIRNLVSTLVDIQNDYGSNYLNDLHPGNIGVDPGSVRTKDPKFILFDP